ncbi:unnamed protein product, partial [Rangifer tarandus platyrhynchus]
DAFQQQQQQQGPHAQAGGWGGGADRNSAPVSNLLAGAGLGLRFPNAGRGNRYGRAAPTPPEKLDPTGPENSAISVPPPPRKPPNSLCPRPQEMSFSSTASKQASDPHYSPEIGD